MAVEKPIELAIPQRMLAALPNNSDEPEQKFVVPLDGRWIPSMKSIKLGKNFSVMTNVRYGASYPESILGMSAVNAVACHATYSRPRTGFHYRKLAYNESHLLVQAFNAGLTASVVLDNPITIGSTGEFTTTPLFTDSAGAGLGIFSDTPDGRVGYCNGVDVALYSGEETTCPSFINFDPNNLFKYDYSERFWNLLQDTENVGKLYTTGGGIDADTSILLACDNNVTDASLAPHTISNHSVTFDTTHKVFGTHGAVFGGAAYLHIAAPTGINLSGGHFAIDGRWELANLTNTHILLYHSTTLVKVAFTSGSEEPAVGAELVARFRGQQVSWIRWCSLVEPGPEPMPPGRSTCTRRREPSRLKI